MPLQYQFPLAGDKQVSLTEHGLNYQTIPGEPIPAIADGFIVHTQNTKSKNKIIIISHDDGYFSLYGGVSFTPTHLLNKPIYRNQILTKATDELNLMILGNKMGWITGKSYNPVSFIKGRLAPSTRSGGLKGYHIENPSPMVLEFMREKFVNKSLMRRSDDNSKILVALQILVSNYTAPISFDGVLGRYSAIGIQRFINARGGNIEVNGIITEEIWNNLIKML